MMAIPNTEYITVNKDGIFIGGKPAKTYRCHNIYLLEDTNEGFARLQAKNPNLIELHAMTSKTIGKYGTPGNPVAEHGPTEWGRAKFVDGHISPWVFIETREHMYGKNKINEDYAAQECAVFCAYKCVTYAIEHKYFYAQLFDMDNKLNQILQIMQLSELPVYKTFLNGYKILVEKTTENTK